MAENDVDEKPLENDEPLEDVSSDEEKKGLSKPTIIKIAIGVTLLILLSIGGYFFFASSDEPTPDESEDISETDQGDTVSDSVAKLMEGNAPTSSEDLIETNKDDAILDSEDTATESEADTDLKSGDNSGSMTISPSEEPAMNMVEIQQKTTALQQENLQIKQRISKLEELINQQATVLQSQDNNKQAISSFDDTMDFQQGLDHHSTEQQVNRTPPPEPKWGDFDRVNKTK
ncbi:MAG: hypothetical protein COB23_03950 [Methylophaga sp.]|nr:MAG: hypothetical protein COB23_03950 [Methylophaga sp.]